MNPRVRACLAAGALLVVARSAFCDIVSIPPGALDRGRMPVSAWADVTFAPNTITVALHNTQSDTLSIGQTINSFSFTVTQNPTSLSMVSSSGYDRNIASNGTYVDAAPWLTGWSASFTNRIVWLVAPSPTDFMIGPPDTTGSYDDADWTILGNAENNPFLGPDATFVINAPGVTAATHVQVAQFGLGTSTDAVAGQVVLGDPNTPEPASLALLAAGGTLLLTFEKRGRAARRH